MFTAYIPLIFMTLRLKHVLVKEHINWHLMVVAIGVYTTKYGIRKQKFVNVQKVTVQLLTESASNATIELHSGTPNENGALVFKDIIKNFLQQPV